MGKHTYPIETSSNDLICFSLQKIQTSDDCGFVVQPVRPDLLLAIFGWT